MASSSLIASVHGPDKAATRELPRRPQYDALDAELREAFVCSLQRGPKLEATLNQVLAYVLDHPGSLARPRISYQIAMAHGFGKQAAQELSIALEYFHTASLLFDDLPCMDDATMRRGAMCTHLKYSESGAILAALALINCAYGLAWKALRTAPAEMQEAAFRYLEKRLGAEGLLSGQSLDLNFKANTKGIVATERVARSKTVPLIELTLVLPAIAGQAAPREIQLLERLSACWGLAYQMADDLKDVLAAQEQTGKTAARDSTLGRPNIALAIGVPAAVERLGRLIHDGDRSLEKLLALRPPIAFLLDFRASLREELSRAIEGAGAIPIDKAR